MGKNSSDKYVRLEKKSVSEASAFLFHLGNQFAATGAAESAFNCFKFAIEVDHKNQAAVHNLGALYAQMGNVDGARRMFEEASRMRPADLGSRVALAEVYRKLGRPRDARNVLDAVEKKDPSMLPLLSAKASLSYDLGLLEDAERYNEAALAISPNDNVMNLNRALIRMIHGEWVDQWKNYEYYLSYARNARMRDLQMSDSWAGQELPGKTIIVISDQGHGDAIQMSRYLAEAKAQGKFGKLTFLVQPDLKDLIRRSTPVDEVVGFGEREDSPADAFSSLLGIMRVLEVAPGNCWRPPHIVTDGRLDRVWEHRVGSRWDGKSKKVGITWAGDGRHGNDHARSIPLTTFLSLRDADNVQLFSFQVGPPLKQLYDLGGDSRLEELGSDFRNYDDTASAMRQMDLLVSCDTSVVHLAGCMGKRAWVLVPNPPEWRWLLSGEESRWYDGVRIFRQETPREWEPTMRLVAEELAKFEAPVAGAAHV